MKIRASALLRANDDTELYFQQFTKDYKKALIFF